MKNDCLISVIIPVYNAEKYISQTLESVAKQTYTNIEIVIVNDNSVDSSEKIIYEWMHNNTIKIIYHKNKQNLGVAEARKVGIEISTGELVAFLDADDIWVSSKLKKQVQYFIEHPNIVLVHTYMRGFNDQIFYKSSKFQQKLVNQLEGYIYNRLLMGNMLCTSSVIVKKQIFSEVGYFCKEYSPSEDWDIWLKIAYHYPIGLIKEYLVNYRDVSSGISKNIEAYKKAVISVFNKHFENIESNQKKAVFRKFISYYNYNVGNQYLSCGNIIMTMKNYMNIYCFWHQKFNPYYYKNIVKLFLIIFHKFSKELFDKN